ncbi:MAG: ATP-binding protein [Spirochaetales bacterium]|nr:ATP-binding protein [Spirochaetales bacterium]MDD7270830.1 ATP-binding protein [Spirochaetales bacterium]
MSNKLLKRALDRLDQFPKKEVEKLVRMQIAEADMLDAILEESPIGHLLIKDKIIRYVNTSFCTLLPTDRRYLRKNAEGKHIKDLVVDKEVLDYLVTLSAKNVRDEKEFNFQVGSEVRTILITHRIVETEEGDYLDINVRDVTEEKRREARLRRSESLASMTTMAAGIAHEIKNPLAAMQIHLQLLHKAFVKKTALTEEDASRYLNVIEEEIERLNRIAVDFLFAVRPMNIDLKLCSVDEILKGLCEFISPEIESHGIKLVWQVEKYLPKLMMDKQHINQALLNIIQNAIHAMDDGGTLTLSVKNDGDFVLFSISDTGCGIKEENLAKIFEPYFTTKATGTGLGLTNVYKIVKEHSGDISVESKVGKGTTFYIRLPVPTSQRVQLDHIEEV